MSDGYETPSLLSHPDREAAAALPALEDLFRSVARKVRTRLVNRSAADIPVRLGVAQVTTVGNIMDDSESRSGGVFALIRFEPLGLPGLIVMQGRLLSRIVGVMLGESPDEEAPPYRSRQVTEVEMRIAERTCEDVINGLMATWPSSKPITVSLGEIGTNPRAAAGMANSTPVVAASLDFGRPDDPYGLMIIAIPAQSTRDLRVQQVKATSRGKRDGEIDLNRVMDMEMHTVAELAKVTIPLSKLKSLGVGGMIDLGPARLVKLMINGHTAILGEPGESRGSHSLRVVERVGGSPPPLTLVKSGPKDHEPPDSD